MRRRVISLGSLVIAVVALAVVLLNATLVDRRAPTITRVTLSAAANGDPARAQTVTAIDIDFSEPVRQGTVERRFRIDPYVAGTLSWDGSTAIFSPSQKLPQDTAFQVFIDEGFEDLAGNVATSGLDGWAFRTVGPPQVLSADPADDTEGVAVDAAITITFDRLMDTSAVEAAVELQPAAAFRAAWSGQAVTLTVDDPLAFGTEYTVSVGTDASDTDGNRLRDPFETRFTTVAAGLGIRAIVPTEGVAGVSVRTPIAVVFDGPVEPSSIDGALQITPPVPGGLELVAAVTDAAPAPSPSDDPPDPTILIFRPSQPLAAHTTYTVTLEPVVSPLGSPGEVAAGRTWTFTTGQPAVSGQNQIAFISDRAGVGNVWLMNPDGSSPRQLTTELVPVAGFDVTADGAQVAWSAGGQVKVMQIDGTGERTLTTGGRFEYGPRFSPDGRKLLVARRDAGGVDVGYWLTPLDTATGDELQVLDSGAPPLGSVDLAGDGIEQGSGLPVWAARSAFSADGVYLALTVADGSVRLVDLTVPAPLAAGRDTGLASTAAPVWSPTAERFFVAGRGTGDEADALHSIATDGRIAKLFGASGSVAASVDGLIGVLVPEGSAGSHVAAGRPDGAAAPQPLTTEPGFADRWPTFAPDGRSVLFGRVATGAVTTSQGIWVVETTGSALSRLTTDGAYPRWLP